MVDLGSEPGALGLWSAKVSSATPGSAVLNPASEPKDLSEFPN